MKVVPEELLSSIHICIGTIEVEFVPTGLPRKVVFIRPVHFNFFILFLRCSCELSYPRVKITAMMFGQTGSCLTSNIRTVLH